MGYKLLSTERYIRLYNNPWDNKGFSEEYLLNITVEELLNIVTAKPDDPLLYDGVILSADQVNKLMEFFERKIVTDFTKSNYVLEADGIYDWSIKLD